MEYFRIQQIKKHLYRIYGVADEQMYLIEGTEKAVLIDTGCGIGDVKEIVESLTDKPVFVLLTHGHVDHAFGAAGFDEIYMNHKDKEVYIRHAKEENARLFLEMVPDFKEEWMKVKKTVPDVSGLKDLEDGDSFDLGGLHIDAYGCPGHTWGSMCFLLREDRILILGDACNTMTYLFFPEATPVEVYKESLSRLKKAVDKKADLVFFSHGTVESGMEVIDQVIQTCNVVTEGKIGCQEITSMAYTGRIVQPVDEFMERKDKKIGNLVISQSAAAAFQ